MYFLWHDIGIIIISSGPGLLRNIHVKIHISLQRISNLASDWLAAQLPANQMPGLKIHVRKSLLTNMEFNMEFAC